MNDNLDVLPVGDEPGQAVSRRGFVALSVAAGLTTTGAGAGAAPARSLVETDVLIKTPDGSCDAAFICPSGGASPGVLIWPDAFGLRTAMRDMARRLAVEGYAVLVPNLFYRVGKAPQFMSASDASFANPDDRAKLEPLLASVRAPGHAERDAAAYLAFLDSQPQVDKARRIGTQGYCLGGPLALKTAAALPTRVGAAASFHGGGLVTGQADSPHLLAPRIQAATYFAIAANDDQRQPDAKDQLRQAFAATGRPTQVEVYPARHGWCVPDMPMEGDAPIYQQAEADKAWLRLLALYRSGLA